MQKQKIIAVVGPTASGKTALAVEIAKRFNGEVVSADSMQLYKGMSIASAKPTDDEMQSVSHHLIDFLENDERYSVAQFVSDAGRTVSDILSRGKLPIICGGTGLYIDSFVNNIEFVFDGFNETVREKLNERLENEGIDVLYNELSDIDGEYASSIEKNNIKRVIRALELYYTSGKRMSEQLNESRSTPSPYETLFIGLSCSDRQKLYDRINERVDRMIENGLVEEAKCFYAGNTAKTANQAIGIKELKPYLDGNESLEDAVECIKRETRRYAKRQLTWFKRNENIHWLYTDLNPDYISDATELVCEFLKRG